MATALRAGVPDVRDAHLSTPPKAARAARRLLTDVADAVAARQEVDWDRCAARAVGGQRRLLANLRAIAGLFASRAGRRSVPVAPARGEPYAAFRALGALLAVALLECAASLAVLPRIWDDYHRAYGPGATYLAVILVAYVLCAAPLLIGGRGDSRAWLLGVYFALMASIPAAHILPFFLWGAAPAGDVPYTIYLHPFVLRPAVLWRFTREFPRIQRRSRIDEAARRMVPAVALVGIGDAVAFVPLRILAQRGAVSPDLVTVYQDASFALFTLIETAALLVLFLRARGASHDEFTRIALFGGGFLIWSLGSTVYDVIETFRPGFFLANMALTPFVLLLGAMRLACQATMIYAVVARGALDVRVVVRASYRRLLARRLLAVAVVVPAAVLVWQIASRQNQTVTAVLADPYIRVLGAATLGALAAVVGRRRLLGRLDAWVYPGSADQGRLLAAAGGMLAQASRAGQVGEVVVRCVRDGCGAPASLLIAADAADSHAHGFVGTSSATLPLTRVSAIVDAVRATRRSIPVARDDPASAFDLLPEGDAEWVHATAAAVVVPVTGAGVEILGIVVVGRRVDDRLPSSFDLIFVETLAVAAGLALQRLTPAAKAVESPAARECPGCGLLAPADGGERCVCGGAWRRAPIPGRLAAAYRVERRLGAGGMGTVYLAWDEELERPVAVKTLTATAADRLVGLKEEARVMAAIQHPAVAQIHGLETWSGRPFLLVEYLAGGTLAERLRGGPLPVARAVDIAVTVASGLEALHAAGYLHRDVKPSNIGFTASRAAKLFDVGLACLADAGDQAAGGTVPYASPEVLHGAAPGAADDVWALGVVLYEMVTGRHPFAAGGDSLQAIDRIRRQQIAVPSRSGLPPGPESSTALAFVTRFLAARPAARIATARAFADALRAL